MATIVRSVDSVLTLSQSCVDELGSNFPFYGNLSEANGYHGSMLEGQLWAHTDPARRLQALRSATERIDQLSFKGVKTITSQPLEFPRFGLDTIPKQIREATYVLALVLLSGINPDTEQENLRLTSSGFGSIRSERDRDKVPHHIVCGIPSLRAWNLLLPFLSEQRGLLLERVS